MCSSRGNCPNPALRGPTYTPATLCCIISNPYLYRSLLRPRALVRTQSAMPRTQRSHSSPETETDSVTSTASANFFGRVDGTRLIARLQDTANPSSMSNTREDILQIIRTEEDHAMSLLAASPLLSSLFLKYANKATALDGPPAPSPIDLE